MIKNITYKEYEANFYRHLSREHYRQNGTTFYNTPILKSIIDALLISSWENQQELMEIVKNMEIK